MASKSNGRVVSDWFDISVPLREGMVVWPNDIRVQIEHRHSIQRPDSGTNSGVFMGVHTGTHMDAPRHFFAKGREHRPDAFQYLLLGESELSRLKTMFLSKQKNSNNTT